jgi:hypothetical protein
MIQEIGYRKYEAEYRIKAYNTGYKRQEICLRIQNTRYRFQHTKCKRDSPGDRIDETGFTIFDTGDTFHM